MKSVLIVNIFLFVQSIQALNESCTSSLDCSATLNSKCIDNKCQCDVLSYLNDKNEKCLTYATAYKDICEEDKQCQTYEKTFGCHKSKCSCGEGKYWFKGKCVNQKNLGETCEEGGCYNGYDVNAMKCNETKICACNDDYYPRGEIDCRKKSVTSCAIDLDCQKGGRGEKCSSQGKCYSPKNLLEIEVPLLELDERDDEIELPTLALYDTMQTSFSDCNETIDCDDFNSNCENNKCQCLSGFTRISDVCLPGFRSCKTDKDCSNVKNSTCFMEQTCICQPGYFLKDGKCLGEIGIGCSSSTDQCANVFAECSKDTKTCSCTDNAYTNDEFTYCTKSAGQARNFYCLTDSWCKSYGPYSYCGQDKICKCANDTKLEKDMACKPETAFNRKNICLTDVECGKFSSCIENQCRCNNGFTLGDDKECQPVFNGSCLLDSCPKGLPCIAGTCQCEKNLIFYPDHNICLSIVNNIGGDCQIDEQCQKFDFAECADKKCSCKSDCVYLDEHRNCYVNKTYSSYCSKNYECSYVLGDDFQCRSNICQCRIGDMFKNNKCGASSGEKLGISVFMAVIYCVFFLLK